MRAVNVNVALSQWDAVAEAAAAARRLNREFCAKRVSDEQLTRIAGELSALADELGTGEPRSKEADMLSRPFLSDIYAGKFAPIPIADGEVIEFDPFSIGNGLLHPASIGIKFVRESAESIIGTCTIDPMFAGPPERAHGGMLALVIDEVMGTLIRMLGFQAFTANLSIDYRAPTPLGEPLRFRSWIANVEGRKRTLRATGHGPEGLCVEATGLFIERKPEPDAS